MARDLYEITPEGKLRPHFHVGQIRAWDSEKRFVCILAGAQGGKTSFGPMWLYREMRCRGPGDYLVVTPTYKLLQRKLLPEFRRLFERYLRVGEYKAGDKVFQPTEAGAHQLWGETAGWRDTHIFFGYAEDPESLASATAKAAWCDEAGQKKFKLSAWEEIQRRLAIHEGRALVTTTLYNLGWVVECLDRPWREAGGDHPEIDVIRFESIQNPAFPESEWHRLKREQPGWKFDLMMRAIPTRPAGLIYETFDPERDKVARFRVPDEWPRYLGVDFGGVNTAALFYAKNPGEEAVGGVEPGQLVAYRAYKAGGVTTKKHADAILDGEPGFKVAFGGAKSEGQWRREFRAAGLTLREPVIHEVEVGIDRVYGFHARGDLKVFADLRGYLEEKRTYSRELDETGQPTEKIEDKETFHYMDAERYVLSYLAPKVGRKPRKPLIKRW